jgi:hypothetical protein
MAASTPSMCFRSESLAVYSCRRARAESREGRGEGIVRRGRGEGRGFRRQGGNYRVQEAGFRVQVLPYTIVIPAEAGIQVSRPNFDPRMRGDDRLPGSSPCLLNPEF